MMCLSGSHQEQQCQWLQLEGSTARVLRLCCMQGEMPGCVFDAKQQVKAPWDAPKQRC
jgi:hypothetical protein